MFGEQDNANSSNNNGQPRDSNDIVGDEPEISASAALNDNGKRSGKRRFVEDDCVSVMNVSHPIDWHMRMPVNLEEQEAKRSKQLLEDEIVHRLSMRIMDAQRKRRSLQVDTVENTPAGDGNNSKEMVQIMRSPPIDGSAWLGVSSDGNEERFYIRFFRKSHVSTVNSRLYKGHIQILNSRSFEKTTEELNIIKKMRQERYVNENLDAHLSNTVDDMDSSKMDQNLWVNKYKPRCYADLLSDDGINRNLLTWIKLWDECVFNKKLIHLESNMNENNKGLYTLDNGRIKKPQYKIVLLSGPAGLGKTTLASIVASHAGYSTVELNASDNRSIADFERILEGTIRTVRTLDRGCRPNCLIIDEIDGAPIETVKYLVKIVQSSGKKAIRRPIICICNSLYTPSLRELRSIALNIHMIPTKQDRIVERLVTIASDEQVKVSRGCLMKLVELCRCDVRFSLNTLQILSTSAKVNNRSITVNEVQQAVEYERLDISSIFGNWSTILELSKHFDSKGLLRTISERAIIVDRVASENSDDRFVVGLHANYIGLNLPIGTISDAAKLFLFYDQINLMVHEYHNYELMKYLISFYVLLHLTVATHSKAQLKYPHMEQSEYHRKRESFDTLKSLRLVSCCSPSSLILDILPMVIPIVQPPIIPKNQQLYNGRELTDIHSAVRAMMEYNLTFAPTLVKGEAQYLFQPAIDVLTMYSLRDDSHRIYLSNATRQLIAHKIELFRMKLHFEENMQPQRKTAKLVSDPTPIKNKITLHFKYNQGFSNAVKKNIKISQLIPHNGREW